MSTTKPSGKAVGSTARARSTKPGGAGQMDTELPVEAERSEFHVEQAALASESSDKGSGSFEGETSDSFAGETSPSLASDTWQDEAQQDRFPTGENLGEAAGSLRKDIKDTATTASRAIRQQASEFASNIGHELERTADDQKRRGGEAMMGFAHAFDTAANELESQSPLVARYVRDAARQVENLSGTITNRSINDLLRAASDLARSRPIMFFGGAVAAGIVLSRFFKSSAHHERRYGDNGQPRDFDGGRSSDTPMSRPEVSPRGADMPLHS